MAGDGQKQSFGNVDLDHSSLAVEMAGRDLIKDSTIVKNSYFLLFGDRTSDALVDRDWALRVVLGPLKDEVAKRLRLSLYGLAMEIHKSYV
jgi:hypothetical protein